MHAVVLSTIVAARYSVISAICQKRGIDFHDGDSSFDEGFDFETEQAALDRFDGPVPERVLLRLKQEGYCLKRTPVCVVE
jgi:hypothetical protein